MPNRVEITGKRFGRLVAIKLSHMKDSQSYWEFACDCGRAIVLKSAKAISGNTSSCGCLKIEMLVNRSTTHGMSPRKNPPRVLLAWRNLLTRCNNRSRKSWKNYGGRGIKCLWKSFEDFYKDMGSPPTESHTLDRTDPNGNYCKENCRWATWKEQGKTRRNSKILTFQGKKLSLVEWAEITRINYWTMKHRYNKGLTPEKILEKKGEHRV